MTTTVMEAPTMTLKQAEDAIAEWQTKLNQARIELQQHEQQLGHLALTSGTLQATRELANLRDAVVVAEQAIQAAQAQRVAVQRQEQLERAKQLRVDLAELNQQAEGYGAFITEWEPKVTEAHQQLKLAVLRMSTMERQLESIELKHGKGQTNGR